MSAYQLWEQFQKSGSVADYLRYAQQKGNYDSQRSCPVSETVQRTG